MATMLRRTIARLGRDEAGASMVEYTVLLALTLGISLAVISATGSQLNTVWNNLNSALSAAISS
jgi:Flp pilus assembly pilin Flp